MAYNTKAILKDVNGNPISQYYNSTTDEYEYLGGLGGGNKVILYNEDGSENNELSLTPILNSLNQLVGTVVDESTRQSNENTRIDSENTRNSNESARQSNEFIRMVNESGRVSAESARQAMAQDLSVWGEYDPIVSYEPLNKVFYLGSSFVCKVACTGIAPTNTTYWQMIASRGLDGNGSGDMLKMIYDKDDNGVIDLSEAVLLENKQTNKAYHIQVRVSVEGKPQLLYKEI